MLGKTGCTLLAFPCIALLDFSFKQRLKTYYTQEIEIWMKSHPNTVVTHYQTAGLFGKAYLNSATTAIAAGEIRKTGLLPCNCHIFNERDFLEESHRTITRCLFESPVPCTNISEQPSPLAAQIHIPYTNSHSACFTKRPCCCSAVKVGLVRDIFGKEQEQSTKHAAFIQRICCYCDGSPYKNKLQEDLKEKETRNQRKFSKYGLQKKKESGLCDAYVSVHW